MFNYFQAFDTLEEDEVKFVAVCLIFGLDYYHSRNIAYVDLRPENIILNENLYLMLEDLNPGMIKEDKIFAAVEVMAPELYKGKKTLAADLWALGSSLY